MSKLDTWYHIVIATFDAKFSYLSIPLHGDWKPVVDSLPVLFTRLVGKRWDIVQLNTFDLILADERAVAIILEYGEQLEVPIIAFKHPNANEFTASDIGIERIGDAAISDGLAIECVWQHVKPLAVSMREYAELHPPRIAAPRPEEPVRLERVKKPKKEVAPVNPTARPDTEPDSDLWIINCADCGKERKCHKPDLFQVKRCVECQAAHQKKKRERESEKVELSL